MERRRFVQLMTLAGASGLAAMEVKHAAGTKTITWHVRGFTCITCAVGLETMLGKQKGVHSVKATYPDGKVVVQYDPASITEAALKQFISALGFTAEPAQQG
jgi:copper chaperone CopZ